MPHYKNFAQCVGQLLKEHQLTASALGAQIGARSVPPGSMYSCTRCTTASAAHGGQVYVKGFAYLVPSPTKNVKN